MVEVRQTKEFSVWLRDLRDANAVVRIVARIVEMRIAYGPGYRIYYVHRGAQIVILLCGGDKRTQRRDIERAQILAENYDAQDDTI